MGHSTDKGKSMFEDDIGTEMEIALNWVGEHPYYSLGWFKYLF